MGRRQASWNISDVIRLFESPGANPRFVFLGRLDLLVMLLRPRHRARLYLGLLIELSRMTTPTEATPFVLPFGRMTGKAIWRMF